MVKKPILEESACFINREGSSKEHCFEIIDSSYITERIKNSLKCFHRPSTHFYYERYEFYKIDDSDEPFAYKRNPESYIQEYLNEYLGTRFFTKYNVSNIRGSFVPCKTLETKCGDCYYNYAHRGFCNRAADFSQQISLSLKMDPEAYCIEKKYAYDYPECRKCEMNPKTKNKLADAHIKNDSNTRRMIISDFRYFGHPVKIALDYTYYPCSRKKEFMHDLSFLYGKSEDPKRVSKRLGMHIAEELLNGVGPKYISEACAIPHGTIKAWRSNDAELCRKYHDSKRVRTIFGSLYEELFPLEASKSRKASAYETSVYKAPKCMMLYSQAASLHESAMLQDVYPLTLWKRTELSLMKKGAEAPRGLGNSWASTFLLYYDWFCANRLDYPHIRSLLACCMAAAQESDPQGMDSLNQVLRQITSEFDQADSSIVKLIEAIILGIAEMILHDFTDISASELYRRMAIRQRIRNYSSNRSGHRLDEKICLFWTVIRQTIGKSTAAPDNSLTQMDYHDLAAIDSFISQCTLSEKEIALTLSCYNPVMLSKLSTSRISNNYPKFMFNHLNDGRIDFSTIREGGISLRELHALLKCGLLNEDNTSPISPLDLASFL